MAALLECGIEVSTHSRPKAAGLKRIQFLDVLQVSTHSRPKAAGYFNQTAFSVCDVSTHSRPKAAGSRCAALYPRIDCFNSQPPEGGWSLVVPQITSDGPGFNSQPPEGGWLASIACWSSR